MLYTYWTPLLVSDRFRASSAAQRSCSDMRGNLVALDVAYNLLVFKVDIHVAVRRQESLPFIDLDSSYPPFFFSFLLPPLSSRSHSIDPRFWRIRMFCKHIRVLQTPRFR